MKQQRSKREQLKQQALDRSSTEVQENGRTERENAKMADIAAASNVSDAAGTTPMLSEAGGDQSQASPESDASQSQAPAQQGGEQSQDNGRSDAENAKLAAIAALEQPQQIDTTEVSAPSNSLDEEAETEQDAMGVEAVGNGGQANAAPPAGGGDGEGDEGDEGAASAEFDGALGSENADPGDAPGDAGGGGGDGAAASDGGGDGGGAAGGGGGGGGGGDAGGSDAPEVEAQTLEMSNMGSNQAFETFQTATPSQMANNWNDLGGVMNEANTTEASEFTESVPDFDAQMSGEQATDAQTQIQNVSGNPGNVDDSPSQAPDPEIAETEHGQQPDRRVNRGIFGGWSEGEEADTSGNARAVARGIGGVSTSGGDVQTSPGAAPPVPLQGESDPARVGQKFTDGLAEANTGALDAEQAVRSSPGSEQVVPLEMHETFEVPGLAEPAGIGETIPENNLEEYVALNLPGGVQNAFDEFNADQFQGNLQQGTADLQAAADTRDTDRTAELDRANAENQRLTNEANAQQMTEVSNQRNLIDAERESTIQQQRAAVTNVQADLDTQRQNQLSEIDNRVAADQARINAEYANAERDAASEVAAGERRAAEEKRKSEREADNRSWWEKACDFVADAISALADLVSDIFNAVREAVTAILDAVKELANTIIDAAVSFINEAIAAFGEIVKGAIQGLLGEVFPELANALCEYVDSAVTYAQEAVTALGEQLKEGIAALCDAVSAVLNTILSIYEAAINTALAFASAIITGDWQQFLLQALEAALTIAGISKDEFYAFIGRAEDTIDIIVNDPGAFIGNCIDALAEGFGQFSDNFLDHLQVGFIDWLTGQAGDAGIELPEELNMAGVFDICLQVLGLTPDALREKAVEHLGEENVERIEFVWGFIESTIEGGLAGLWEHVQEYMGSMWDMVIGGIQDWLMEKIVVAAVTKIASMFSPVGAIVQALITAWNMYCFVRDQIQRIYGVVTAIVNGIGDIARGNIGGAANMVEEQLANLVPVAIDLLARLLGIGGIGAKVREVIEGVQTMVSDALDSMIEKVKGFFTGGDSDSSSESGGTEQGEDAESAEGDTGTAAEEQQDTTAPRLSGNWNTIGRTPYEGSDGSMAMISATGSYNLSIANQQTLEQNFKQGENWNNQSMSDWVNAKISNATKAAMGQSGLPVMDLLAAGSYSSIASTAKSNATAELASIGVAVDNLNVGRISGGEELDASIDQAAADAIIGANVSFSAGDEAHRIWIEDQGDRATIMVASTPMPLNDQLANMRGKVSDLSQDDQGTANGLFSQAQAIGTELQPAIDASAREDGANDQGVADTERRLATVMGNLFELFAEINGGDLDERAQAEGGLAVTKLAEINGETQGGAVALVPEWKNNVLARVEAGSSVLDAMRTEVSANGSKYILKGDSVPGSAIQSAGGVSRVVDLPAVFNYYLPQAIKDRFGGDAEAFCAAVNRGEYNPTNDMTGQLRGQLAEAWWFARNSAPSMVLSELIDELAINESPQYNKGVIRLDFNVADAMATADLHKPTAFDGMPFGQFRPSPGNVWGVTAGGVLEAVAPALPVSSASSRTLIVGSQTEPLAANDQEASGPTAEEAVDEGSQGEAPATDAPAIADADDAAPNREELSRRLPSNEFTDQSGERHTLRIHTQGRRSEVRRHSVSVRVTEMEGPYEVAQRIEQATNNYMDPEYQGDRDALLQAIRSDMQTLQTKMAEARGDGVDLVESRKKLEVEIGKAAMADGNARGAVQGMCDTAIRHLAVKVEPSMAVAESIDDVLAGLSGNEAFRSLVSGIGVDINRGYAGGVGQGYNEVMAVMRGGNIREQITHLSNWSETFAQDVYGFENPADLRQFLAQIQLDAPQIQRIVDQKMATQAAGDGARDGKKHKALQRQLDNNSGQQAYADAKHSEMDAKIPDVPLEALDLRELEFKARTKGVTVPAGGDDDSRRQALIAALHAAGVTSAGGAEGSPLARSTRSRNDPGIELSDRESSAVGLSEELLPFIEGWKANMVKPENDWIQAARDLNMPLRAGISGTTYRFMSQSQMMGADVFGSRLALLGHLIPMNAHSYHEIMSAAAPYAPYRQGSYVPLAPWSNPFVKDLAKRAGIADDAIEEVVGG